MCDVEVIVVKAPAGEIDLRCGGHEMATLDGTKTGELSPAAGFDHGLQVGKRYTDESGSIEILCTKPGPSSLSIGDTVLETKEAKPLPSSD